MQGISIVKLTNRHSKAYDHRGRRLIERRLLLKEILYPICDSIFEISATQLRSLAEIALKSPLFCVNRRPIAYGFSAGAKDIRYSVNIAIKKGKSFPQGEIKPYVIMRCPF